MSDDICKILSEYAPTDLISVSGLAKVLGKHQNTIQRAIARGELPQPVMWIGRRRWMVQALIDHFTLLQTRQSEPDRIKPAQKAKRQIRGQKISRLRDFRP